MKTVAKLIEYRMLLASSIAHSRLMIHRNYYPEFFNKLLKKQQTRQSNLLHQERKLQKQ